MSEAAPRVTNPAPAPAPKRFDSVDAVLDHFAGDAGRASLNAYVTMQSPRYLRLLEVLRQFTALDSLEAPRVADIGPGLQTELVAARWPAAQITTVGYDDHAQSTYAGNIEYDLNATYDKASWPVVSEADQFDVVVFCEVIEHLYTTPIAVLGWLRTLVKPGGSLIIQTPNSQAITRRIRAVIGKPLYGRITNFGEPGMNPGHFREYTPGELREMGERTGFEVTHLEIANYIHHQGAKGRAMMRAYDLMPESLRQGVTIVYRAI